MNKVFIILAATLFSAVLANAQDIITKKTGEDIKAKVLEVTTNEVKYKFFDEPDGATYTIRQSEIALIRYESGRNEVFNQNNNSIAYSHRESVEGLAPGMKYKELKNLYDYKDYVSEPGDRYNLALAGITSFLIPGVGQMIDGEVGRGIGFLCGNILCNVAATAMLSNENAYGALLVALGGVGLNIASIVDGVRVAKVKNMYEQDLRNTCNVSIDVHPTITCTQIAGTTKPVAGVTLAINF